MFVKFQFNCVVNEVFEIAFRVVKVRFDIVEPDNVSNWERIVVLSFDIVDVGIDREVLVSEPLNDPDKEAVVWIFSEDCTVEVNVDDIMLFVVLCTLFGNNVDVLTILFVVGVVVNDVWTENRFSTIGVETV